MQIAKNIVWIKAIFKAMVQAFLQFYKREKVYEAIMTHVYIIISYLEESTSIYSCMWMICSLLLKADLLLIN